MCTGSGGGGAQAATITDPLQKTGAYRKAKARVDLPEPDSPTTPKVRPGAILTCAPSTATKEPDLNHPAQPGLGVR